MPSRSRAVLAVTAAVLLVPALTACGANPIENLVEQATGGDVQLGGGEVPDGFPSEIPLFDGEIRYGVAVDSPGGKAFNVTVAIPDASAGQDIQDQLTGAGFTLVGGTEPAAAGGAAYDGTDWGVVVVIADGGDQGWTANYTVTPKDGSSGS